MTATTQSDSKRVQKGNSHHFVWLNHKQAKTTERKSEKSKG